MHKRAHNPARRHALQTLGVTALAPVKLARAQPSKLKVLHYAFEVAETGFDPCQVTDLYSRIAIEHMFEGLYCYDHLARPFKIKPLTAAAMPSVENDYRNWTIRIQAGIYFHDDAAFQGKRRELVAEDYVYSLKRFFDPRWKSPAYASLADLGMLGVAERREQALQTKQPFDYDRPVEGLHALDRYTLAIRLKEPRPRLLQELADSSVGAAVAREVVEYYGDDIMAHPVGTGPFRLAQWRRASRMVFERSTSYRERYYDAEPNADDAEGQALLTRFKGQRIPMIDRVEISIIEETQPRWLSFLNGQLDLMWLLPFDFANLAIPNGELAPNLQRQGLQLHRALAADTTVTYFNMEDPVVGGYSADRVALRRAISLATNIEQEIRLYWRGQGVSAQSGLMPHTTGFDPSYRSENSTYDLPRAKALLDTFGYVDRNGDGWREQPDGAPLTLIIATVPDQRARQRDELRRKDMTALGLRTEFQPAKWPENLKNARAGKLMMWNLGYSAAAPDGQGAFDRGASVHAGGQNLARFRHPRFDEIYSRMRHLPDGAERQALFVEANRLLTVYMPYKFHIHRIVSDISRPWLMGFRRPPYWRHWWSYVDIDLDAQQKARL